MPLLILRAPDNEKKRDLLGQMWGTYFSLATHAMLEDLALCDIVCAPDAQVLRDLPDVSSVKNWTSGIALFLEPGRTTPAVVAGPVVIMPWWKEGNALRESMADALDDVRARLHVLIAPDRATIERRARENRAAHSDVELAALGGVGKTMDIQLRRSQARILPACLLLEQVERDADRHWPVPDLWSRAERRLSTAPEGSRWDLPTQECMRKAFAIFDPDEGCTMPGPLGRTLRAARFLHLMDEVEVLALADPARKPDGK